MIHIKNITFLLSLIICVNQSIAQDYRYVDSLKKVLSKTEIKQDTNIVKIYVRLSSSYVFSKNDSSLYYANKALLLSQHLRFERGIFGALRVKAYPLALLRYDSAAVGCGYALIKMAERQKDTSAMVNAYFTLGSVYIHIRDYNKAILYNHKAINMSRPGNKLGRYACHQHLTESFIGLQQVDSAFFYAQKLTKYGESRHNVIAYDIYLMGSVYFLKHQYQSALRYYKEALKKEANITKKNVADYNIGISQVFEQLGRRDSAIFYTKAAYLVAEKSGLPNEELETLNMMTHLFETGHRIDSAFKYQKAALLLRDSIYNLDKIRQVQQFAFDEQLSKEEEIQEHERLFNKVIIYALIGGLVFSIIIGAIIFRNNGQRRKSYALLQRQQKELIDQKLKVEQTLIELKTTQTQLIQSEKMASLGELTAGIAHEIQNPLNFVNNFSDINRELAAELKENLNAGNMEDAIAIADDIAQNEEKINQHGRRADLIVKGMLQHSRNHTGERQPTNINVLADEFLKLSYHGLRAKDKNFNAELTTNFDVNLPKVNVVQQDIGRVLLNLFNNAFYAVNKKKQMAGADYKPEVTVSTSMENNRVIIQVKDNGTGIPEAIKDKIMQPFFTTKPTGEGTGLGLSLSYDIIAKGHGGSIAVETKENEFTTFTITIPFV